MLRAVELYKNGKEMYKEKKYNNSVVGYNLDQLDKTEQKSVGVSTFISHLDSMNGLHLMAALMQVLLGATVVVLSLAGYIQPFLLASIMSVFGGVVTMIGLYFVYHMITQSGIYDSLLHKAIKRVVNSQN